MSFEYWVWPVFQLNWILTLCARVCLSKRHTSKAHVMFDMNLFFSRTTVRNLLPKDHISKILNIIIFLFVKIVLLFSQCFVFEMKLRNNKMTNFDGIYYALNVSLQRLFWWIEIQYNFHILSNLICLTII